MPDRASKKKEDAVPSFMEECGKKLGLARAGKDMGGEERPVGEKHHLEVPFGFSGIS